MVSAVPVCLVAVCLLALPAAGSSDVSARAACPFTHSQRTFGNDWHRVTMTVADDRPESPCGSGGLRCQPLVHTVRYWQDGSQMETDVKLAWLCAASEPAVRADG